MSLAEYRPGEVYECTCTPESKLHTPEDEHPDIFSIELSPYSILYETPRDDTELGIFVVNVTRSGDRPEVGDAENASDTRSRPGMAMEQRYETVHPRTSTLARQPVEQADEGGGAAGHVTTLTALHWVVIMDRVRAPTIPHPVDAGVPVATTL